MKFIIIKLIFIIKKHWTAFVSVMHLLRTNQSPMNSNNNNNKIFHNTQTDERLSYRSKKVISRFSFLNTLTTIVWLENKWKKLKKKKMKICCKKTFPSNNQEKKIICSLKTGKMSSRTSERKKNFFFLYFHILLHIFFKKRDGKAWKYNFFFFSYCFYFMLGSEKQKKQKSITKCPGKEWKNEKKH